MVRSAFTLIELIFAIVVIGISVISLPTMNQVTSSGLEGNLAQEAIFLASTELNQAVTVNWDDNSFEPNVENAPARVIDILNTCENNSSSSRFRRKPGHILQPYHRRCLNNPATGLAGATANDNVEDFEDLESTSNLNGTGTDKATGYKDDYKVTLAVNENADFNGVNQNIKEITVTIRDSNNDIVTQLNTFSANIGEVDYYKRNY